MSRRKWIPKKFRTRDIPPARKYMYSSIMAELLLEEKKKERVSSEKHTKEVNGFVEEFNKVFNERTELQEIVESRYSTYFGNGWEIPLLNLIKQVTHDVAQTTEVEWSEWWQGLQMIGEHLKLSFPMNSLKIIFEGTREKMK